jgi:hypothetical protein
MSRLAGAFAQLRVVLGVVGKNPDLRRVEIGYAAFNGAEISVWVAMLVYAFDLGGATASGLVAVAQLVPAAIFAPIASVLADRRPPVRVLVAGYVAQGAGMAVTAIVLIADGPAAIAIVAAAFATMAITITRPTQAVLMPSLAHRPEELTAANVVSGWNESMSLLVAPAISGVLLGVSGPGAVFAVMAGAVLVGAVVVSRVKSPPPAVTTTGVGAFAEVSQGMRVVAREPAARMLVGLMGAELTAIGMLDVLYVVLALDVLDMGQAGAGFLNAAFGLGGALAIGVTVSLVGRSRLMPAVIASLVVWAVSFSLLAAWPTIATAFLLIAFAGGARALFHIATRTLLQRTAPPEVLARVFGVLEGTEMTALAVGSLIAPLLVAIGGGRLAILGAGLLLPGLALIAGRRLFELDASAQVPVVEIALLRSMPIFAALPPPEIEGLARCVKPVSVEADDVVITQGEEGDRFYAIADGELEAVEDGIRKRTMKRCDGFGEIALLRDVPRTATVTALTRCQLYALEKERFLEVVTGHPTTAGAAEQIVGERLAPA